MLPGGCSPWNEKALRGSMGSLLRLPVLRPAAAPEAVARLGSLGFRQVRAATRDGTPLERFDWSGRIALWFSSETGGLPAELDAHAFEDVSIAMAGGVESLNVTAAAAILLHAAARGRESPMSGGLFGDDEPRTALPEPAADAPLAERMRPRTLEEYCGQRHLVGAGKILDGALSGDLRQSLILWGPPGSGKTTLAHLIARRSALRFVPFSAVLSGIKEIRAVMAQAAEGRARRGRRSLLFVDEIHRFNKAQQDAFLPHVERGDILLIGATTENPSFEVVGPLLSRARTLILKPLTVTELAGIVERAVADAERGLAGRITIAEPARMRIAEASDGDARRALTLLESAAALVGDGGVVDEAVLVEALQKKQLRYDKAGEEHFNLVSALHKSVRNSDEDASLYWLARMLEAGEDRRYLARRLIRIALEDVGVADPNALSVCVAAAAAWDRLGTPEGELALVQAAVYLARAPKSNRLYVAYDAARADVERSAAEPVPLHLRNAPTGLMRAAGYGAGYRYAHDDPAAAGEMDCLPPSLRGRRYLAEGPAEGPAEAP